MVAALTKILVSSVAFDDVKLSFCACAFNVCCNGSKQEQRRHRFVRVDSVISLLQNLVAMIVYHLKSRLIYKID